MTGNLLIPTVPTAGLRHPRPERWRIASPITVTDDGVRGALEYNCVRWGSHSLTPQAGIAVFERSPDGLLATVRVYDDVDTPIRRP